MDEKDKKIQDLRAMLHDCRNELCLECGKYKTAYQVCEMCPWRFGERWQTT